MPLVSDARKDVVQQKEENLLHHAIKSSPRYTIPLSARYNDIPGVLPQVEREIKAVPGFDKYADKTRMQVAARLSLLGGSMATTEGGTRARTLNGEEGRPKGYSTFGRDPQFMKSLSRRTRHKVREPSFHTHPRHANPGPNHYTVYSSFNSEKPPPPPRAKMISTVS
eukprot:gnl/MRDRNA2_/MRDRNA2_100437_c0_seq1.p1 gnl/MRDRNA2_/MRDRNA2_100437_c0~~gnl/MRDRNA2_/MRDRNA2_100437_c0_seq1.p1  ORF type:complete len:167 (+),score=9.10 gnl/MRDRNA2_/MRDRNA2_100437_c0_seq1:52-552(+)